MIFVAESEQELGNIVFCEIKKNLKGGFVCGLVGDLGAGKTTLVKQLAQKLGVEGEITSPTFNLRKEYPLPKSFDKAKILQHIDLYRLESPSGSDFQEFNDWISDGEALTFVEWPEKMHEFNRAYDLFIHLKNRGNNKRQVEIKWS